MTIDVRELNAYGTQEDELKGIASPTDLVSLEVEVRLAYDQRLPTDGELAEVCIGVAVDEVVRVFGREVAPRTVGALTHKVKRSEPLGEGGSDLETAAYVFARRLFEESGGNRWISASKTSYG